MKATKMYFPVVLFTTLYKLVLTYECVDGIVKNAYSCGDVYYVVQSICNLCSLCKGNWDTGIQVMYRIHLKNHLQR